MWCLPLPPALRLLAPGFAARLGVILAAVAALVAARFVHDPRLAGHTVAVWGWLQRKIRRSAALAGRIAAGRVPVRVPVGAPVRVARVRCGGGGAQVRLPRGQAWLLPLLGMA